jgi:hypothetical protein
MERVALIHVCARPLHNGLLINNKNDQPIEVCAHERVFSANYIDWKVHVVYY